MKLLNTIAALASAFTLATPTAAFDPNGKDNVVLYWGQASAGSQESLGSYCKSNAADVYVVSFLNNFNGNGEMTLTVSGCWENFPGGMANCPAIGEDIKLCQSLGKKVFLSLGGAVGSYGFTSDAGGATLADSLWETFGGGSAAERPFGDAIVDGYDLDIENQQQQGYVGLVKRLREHFATAPATKYYISATPQCPFPDASVGEALAGADIDFAYVQFYNNYCGVNNPGQFNFDTWDNFAKTISPNKNIKVYLGVPASRTAASTGYIDGATLKQFVDKVKDYSSFGGIMMWDASQAFQNKENGVTYAQIAKDALAGLAPAPVVSAATSPVASVPVATSPVASVPASSAPAAVSSAPAPVWSAPAASSADNGMWKPEQSAPAISSVPSLAPVSSAPILAAESGSEEPAASASTTTEFSTVTSVGEVVTTTVPRDTVSSEAPTSAAPSSEAAPSEAVSSEAAPSEAAPTTSSESAPTTSSEAAAEVPASSESSSAPAETTKDKKTVYATTVESVYIDTTVVQVPGPAPTSVLTTVTHTVGQVLTDAPAEAASSAASSADDGMWRPASSAPVVSSVVSLAAPSGPNFAAESGNVNQNKQDPVVVDFTTTTSTSVTVTKMAASELITAAVTSAEAVQAASSATISLSDSAPQKTISPDTATPPCDGKEGTELAKCLNNMYGNQEVISKLSLQDKEVPHQVTETTYTTTTTTAPAVTSTVHAKSTEAPAKAPVQSSAAKPSSSAAKSSASAESKTEPKKTEAPAAPAPSSPGTLGGGSSVPSTCREGDVGCSPTGEFIMCNFNKWVHFACPPTTTCFAVAQGNNAVVGCNFIDAPIPLVKRKNTVRIPKLALPERLA